MSEFDDLLKKSKHQDSEAKKVRDYELHKAAQIKAQGPAIFKQLVKELTERAQEFNATHPEEERRLSFEAYYNAFIARRDHLPQVQAQLDADPYFSKNLISLVVKTRDLLWKVPMPEVDEYYQFDLQSSGRIYISDGPKAVLNDTIIGQFFTPFFRFK
jgi:hypothetical protein